MISGPLKLKRYLIAIKGFRQTARDMTGCESGMVYLQGLFGSRDCYIDNAKWNDDMRELASQIDRMCQPDAQIIIISYSWGTGCGAVQLAWKLRKLGRRVDVVFSIDGVYHSDLFFWRAVWGPLSDRLLGEPVIQFPDNVGRVEMWRQRENIPRGHWIQVVGNTQLGYYPSRVINHGFLTRNHEAMDEAEVVWRRVREWIEQNPCHPERE